MANDNNKLVNQNAVVHGQTIAQWTEDWLKWVAHAPAATPPGTPFGSAPGFPEGSPANALVDNTQPVFFLYGGGWPAPGSAPPTIDVPAHEPILLPLVNAFDIEGPGLETISNFVESGRGSFGDEATFVTNLEEKSIFSSFLTVTKVGQTEPIIDIRAGANHDLEQNTGLFALGDPQSQPLDYLGSLIGTEPRDNLPFTAEIGRWAMIKNLAPGDYIVHFGGAGRQAIDPVSNTILPAFGADATDKLHVV